MGRWRAFSRCSRRRPYAPSPPPAGRDDAMRCKGRLELVDAVSHRVTKRPQEFSLGCLVRVVVFTSCCTCCSVPAGRLQVIGLVGGQDRDYPSGGPALCETDVVQPCSAPMRHLVEAVSKAGGIESRKAHQGRFGFQDLSFAGAANPQSAVVRV